MNKRKLLLAGLFAGFIFLYPSFSLYAQKYYTGLIWEDPTKVPSLHKVEKIGAERGVPIGLPASVDNSSHLPPVRNQQLNDCVAWAFGYYYKTYQEWEEHNWDVTTSDHQFSPAFIYNQINGGLDSGSSFPNAMDLICTMGCAPLSVSPYNPPDYTTWPTEEAYNESLSFRAEENNYLSIDNDIGVGDLKQLLSEGNIAVIGINVWGNFDNISDYDNTYCAADKTGENRGGHAVTVVGYDDNKVTHDGIGAFKLVNSWGTGWGDNGFFWMSYEAIKSSDLCMGYTFYLTDCIDYSPTVKAKFNIGHLKRGQLQIWVGLGDTSSPLWEKQFFPNGETLSSPEDYPDENPFPSNNVVVDISETSGSLNPSGDNPIFLKVTDTVAGDSGIINDYFQIEHLTWGITRTSPETPKDITDDNNPVYVSLNFVLPDLTVTDITCSSASLNQPADIYVTIANQGSQDVTEDFRVDIYYDPSETPTRGETARGEKGLTGDDFQNVTQTVPAGGSIQVSFTHTFATVGTHSIWAQVDTNDDVTETNEDNNISGPYEITINSPPTLSWTGEADYENDGLNPESGSSDTSFIYRVKYTDPDNDAPASGFPKVHILKAGSEITDSPFAMDGVDSDDITYTDGKLYTFTISSLSEGSDYTYYFEAKDIDNAEATGEPTNSRDGPAVNNPPSITPTAITSATRGESLIISAEITDDSGVSSATLYYRKGGKGSYTSVSMSSSDSAYTATISGSEVTERGIEYYIEAKDTYENVAYSPDVANPEESPHRVRVTFSSLSFPFSTWEEKWQMISVSVELDNPGPDAILVDDLGEQDNTVWRLYRWNMQDEAYDEYSDIADSFTPGKAFWLITRDSRSLAVGEGVSVDISNDYVISLFAGWSQIGNSFAFNVDWDDLRVRKGEETVSIQQAQENGWVRDKIWYWNGTEYEFCQAPSGTLEPWKGYWIKALQSCELLISPLEAGESKSVLSSSLSQAGQEFLQFTARVKDSDLKDSYNFIGLSSKAMAGYDAEDVEEAPSIGHYVSLSFPHKDWGKDSGSYTKDIRRASEGSFDKIIWGMQVKTDQLKKIIILKWKNTGVIPLSYYLYLADEDGVVLADMRKIDSYSFVSKTGENIFKVVATTKAISSPEELTLSEVYNYPNPANDTTNIHFKLGAGANLTIKIYTISGELVKTLVENKPYSPGVYSETWKLDNEAGEKVARGIYILLVKVSNSAKTLVKTNKIAVIK